MSISSTKARHPAKPADYLSRAEALAVLGVKRQTLYSYVSRGYIRRVLQPDGRTSYYLREDIDRVKARSVARSGHGPAAAGAVHWGEPVILTGITEITEEGPRYRDRLALDLARERHSFETVAEYLWSGDWPGTPALWQTEAAPPGLRDALATLRRQQDDVHILQLLAQAILSLGLAEDRVAKRARPQGTVTAARRLIHVMAGVHGFLGPRRDYCPLNPGEPIAAGLLRIMGRPPDSATIAALDAAFVLIADHELSPSTFAARIAASVGASLHSCIGAAFNVYRGSVIGFLCDDLERMFEPDAALDVVLRRIEASLVSARTLRGFNHPLYPHGDPRTMMLIELARGVARRRKIAPTMLEAIEHIALKFRASPGLELGLVALAHASGLPRQAASGLFALARTAGWVAHAIEQGGDEFMIRPRAKFAPNPPLF